MTAILIILLSVYFCALALCLYCAIKNGNTFKNHMIIANAIYAFKKDMIKKEAYTSHDILGYEDMESYEKTLYRLWDWGYTRILPKAQYEIIKPYIQKGK